MRKERGEGLMRKERGIGSRGGGACSSGGDRGVANILVVGCAVCKKNYCFPVCIGVRGGCCHKICRSAGSDTGSICTLGNSSCGSAGLPEPITRCQVLFR